MGASINTGMWIPPEIAMFGRQYVHKWQQKAKTLRTYSTWWQLFYTAAVTSFKWEDLPRGIDARYLESGLFFSGAMALTRRVMDSDIAPWVVARFSMEGQPDIYGNPNTIRMIAGNGQEQWKRHCNDWIKTTANQYSKETKLMVPDAVVCWDSITRLPLFDVIDLACARLAEFDVTVDQHVRANRVPYIVVAPEEGRVNAEKFFNDVDSGQPCLYLAPSAMSQLSIQVLNTGIDYIADKLLNDELKIVSQTYTALGIDNNAAAEKKERVQTAETVANNEQFLLQRMARQRARDEFSERCEEVFGIRPTATWAVPHTWESGAEDEAYQEGLEPFTQAKTSTLMFDTSSSGGDGFGTAQL